MRKNRTLYEFNGETVCGYRERQKTVEVRLFDSKRERLKVGDIIVFSRSDESMQSCVTEVIGLDRYDSFQQLFMSHSPDCRIYRFVGRKRCRVYVQILYERAGKRERSLGNQRKVAYQIIYMNKPDQILQ